MLAQGPIDSSFRYPDQFDGTASEWSGVIAPFPCPCFEFGVAVDRNGRGVARMTTSKLSCRDSSTLS